LNNYNIINKKKREEEPKLRAFILGHRMRSANEEILTVTSVFCICSCCVDDNGDESANKQDFEHHVIQGAEEQGAEGSDRKW
jgi:hypothetical protein